MAVTLVPADWGPPLGSKSAHSNDLRVWTQRRNFALVDTFLPQKNNYRWPLEQGTKKDHPNDLRTWTQRRNFALVDTLLPQRNWYDWPLPGRYPRLDQTYLEEGNNFPPVFVQPPFFQTDWPNPKAPYRQDQTWLEPGNVSPPIPTPSFTKDWPLPKAYPRLDQTWLEPGNNLPPVPPGNPFSQTDWPLPGMYSRLDQTWLQTGVFSPPQFLSFPFDWQVTYSQGAGQTWLQNNAPFIPPAVITNPFFQTDWPNPRAYPRLDLTWFEAGNTFPPFQVSFNPLNQYDWPLPKTYLLPAFSWIQSNAAIYSPIVVAPYDPTLRNQYSWPLPGRYSRLDQTWIETGNTSLPRSGSPISLPFRWDLTYPTFMGQTWLQQPTIALPLTISRTPTYSLSWKYPRLIQTDVKNSVLFATIPVRPQFPIAWPLPTPRFRIDPTWLQNNTRFVTFAKPVSQTDWPLPQRNIYSDKAWLQSESIGDLLTTPQPVFTYDQSLPRTYPRLIQPVTFPNLNIVVTASHLYSLPFDWPVPKGYPRMDQTWTQETALLYNQSPFAHPFDWPYIPGPPRIEQTVIESNAAILHLAGFSPFSQTDWPLYRARPAYPGIDQTWLQTRALILPPPLKPPLEYDWPNPKAYGRSPTLTDIQGNKTLYIPPPSAVVGLHYLPFFATTGQLKTF